MIKALELSIARATLTEGYNGCILELLVMEEKPSLKQGDRVPVQYRIMPEPPFVANEGGDTIIREGGATFHVYTVRRMPKTYIHYTLYWGPMDFVKVGEKLYMPVSEVASRYSLPAFAQAESAFYISSAPGQSLYKVLIEAAKNLKAYHLPVWKLEGLELVPILSKMPVRNNLSMLISPYASTPNAENTGKALWDKTRSAISEPYEVEGYGEPGLVVEGRFDDKILSAVVLKSTITVAGLKMIESRLLMSNLTRTTFAAKPPGVAYSPPNPFVPDIDFSIPNPLPPLSPPPLPPIPAVPTPVVPPLTLPATPSLPPVPNPQLNISIPQPPIPPPPPINAQFSVPTPPSLPQTPQTPQIPSVPPAPTIL